MELQALIDLSHFYGNDPTFVLAGGGNTSYKADGVLAVKGSGSSLASICDEQFVRMDLSKLRDILHKNYPEEDAARETASLADMMAARLPGEEAKRPSVEAVLHAIFPQAYVCHTHPARINGLTCSKDAEVAFARIFGNTAVWIPLIKPGYVLAAECNARFAEYEKYTGRFPNVVILQNHGLFVAADTPEEIHRLSSEVMAKLQAEVSVTPDFTEIDYDVQPYKTHYSMHAALKGKWLSVLGHGSEAVQPFLQSEEAFAPLAKPFTPDHIVYCGAYPMFVAADDLDDALEAYQAKHGLYPKIVAIQGYGVFACGNTENEAELAKTLFLDSVKIASYVPFFGGANPLSPEMIDFILNWEAEAYRKKESI